MADAHDVHVFPLEGLVHSLQVRDAQLRSPLPVEGLELRVDVGLVGDRDQVDAGVAAVQGDEAALVAVPAEAEQENP
jgi:hypothetical protein